MTGAQMTGVVKIVRRRKAGGQRAGCYCNKRDEGAQALPRFSLSLTNILPQANKRKIRES